MLRFYLPFLISILALSSSNASLTDKEAFVDGPEFETTLSNADFANAQIIDEEPAVDPTTKGNHFEGDIMMKEPMNLGDAPDGVLRNAVKSRWDLWSNNQIPYSISSIYSSASRSRIAAAMKDYSAKTCIQFVPRTSQRDYIYITADDGCYSEVGRSGGRQIVSLDSGCLSHGVIVHELMHVAGFFHEQSRADRDDWVEIKWENIERGANGQFKKYSLGQIDHLGTQYDYGSVMHYGATAFSRNGRATITQKKAGPTIGQRRGLSSNDVLKLNKLYNCPGSGGSGGNTNFVRPTQRPISTGGSSSCTDNNDSCSLFASKGYCKRPYLLSYMKRNCCRSCGFSG